jgi:tRNA pseudouridine38-40 synthase
MPRYRLTIEYNGAAYVGWQFQDNGRSVQGAIEAALKAFTHEDVRVHGAGRTDAGVHATGQIAHIDLTRSWDPLKLREAINAWLAYDAIAILQVDAVDETFHARFSATGRHYIYRINDRRAKLTFDKGRAWHIKWPLKAAIMHEAAQRLIGKHDFTTFRAAECQAASPIKTLTRLDVERVGDEIRIYAFARSFLHHQVRSITGSLVEVGSGKWSADDLQSALEARDRTRCGPMAPPDGLYLVKVDYDAK